MTIKIELDNDVKELLVDTLKSIRDYYKTLTTTNADKKAVDCDVLDDETLEETEVEELLWRDAPHCNATTGAWTCETEPRLITDEHYVKIDADFTIQKNGVNGNDGGVLFLLMMPKQYTPSETRKVSATVTRGDTVHQTTVTVQTNELMFLDWPDTELLMKGDKVHIDGEYALK